METPKITTELGDLWFFHPIGMGVVVIFEHKTFKLTTTCCATGLPIAITKREYKTIEEFEKACKEMYIKMIDDSVTSHDFNFFDDVTIVGDSMIEVDFNLLKN